MEMKSYLVSCVFGYVLPLLTSAYRNSYLNGKENTGCVTRTGSHQLSNIFQPASSVVIFASVRSEPQPPDPIEPIVPATRHNIPQRPTGDCQELCQGQKSLSEEEGERLALPTVIKLMKARDVLLPWSNTRNPRFVTRIGQTLEMLLSYLYLAKIQALDSEPVRPPFILSTFQIYGLIHSGWRMLSGGCLLWKVPSSWRVVTYAHTAYICKIAQALTRVLSRTFAYLHHGVIG